MRFLSISLAVAAALTMAACASKSSSNSSDQSNAAATTAAGAAAPAASAAASTAAAPADQIPSYPGAVTAYAGSSQGSSGTVMTTDDSFDKVYAWYQQNLPAGSEKAHVTAPVQSAVFSIGPDNDRTSVSITASAGKTTITIAHQKM
jgi:hypothetical protein